MLRLFIFKSGLFSIKTTTPTAFMSSSFLLKKILSIAERTDRYTNQRLVKTAHSIIFVCIRRNNGNQPRHIHVRTQTLV